MLGGMNEYPWASASLANLFVDEAYASVKGYVRTYVLHQHLLEHLPMPRLSSLRWNGDGRMPWHPSTFERGSVSSGYAAGLTRQKKSAS